MRTAEAIYTSLLTSSSSDVTGQYLVDGGVTANLTSLEDGSGNGTTNGRDIEALKLANQCVLMVTLGLTMVGMGAAIEPKDFKIVVSIQNNNNKLRTQVITGKTVLIGRCRPKFTNKLAKHFPQANEILISEYLPTRVKLWLFSNKQRKEVILKEVINVTYRSS